MSSDDIVDRKQEWWSMDTVQRATYVDDLIAEIERLRADIDKHLSEYHDSGLCGCALEGSR